MTKLVIGTRHWLGPDWVHLDADRSPLIDSDGRYHPVDFVGDANTGLPSEIYDHVYSQECLEHFPFAQIAEVVAEWGRLVKPGGTIRIEVPDFLAACKQVLVADTEEMDFAIQQIVFGGQANKWDFHYAGLTPRMLKRLVTEQGFEVEGIERGWEVGYLRIDARKKSS